MGLGVLLLHRDTLFCDNLELFWNMGNVIVRGDASQWQAHFDW